MYVWLFFRNKMDTVCTNCKKRFAHLVTYNKHQYYHRLDVNCRFLCKFENCCQQFTKYRNFRTHIFRKHITQKPTNVSDTYACNIHLCNYKFGIDSQLAAHMYAHIKNGEQIECPFAGCNTKQNFKTSSSFKSHFYRHHFKNIEKRAILNQENLPLQVSNDDIFVDNTTILTDTSQEEEITYTSSEYVEFFAKIYLRLQSKHFLSDAALQTIIDSLVDVNELTLNNIRRLLIQNEVANLNNFESFDIFKIAHNPETGLLRSSFMRKAYFKNYFNFVNPVKIVLEKTRNKSVHFYYVPILETIKVLLNNEYIYNQLKTQNMSDIRVLSNITDGECYKNNSFFKRHTNAVGIILYQDAFEVCNPLGSSRKVHKVVGVYMTLANVPTFLRSKVDQIQLVALCLESQVKKYGFDKVFEAIMRDIRFLETTGLQIKNEIIKGTIIAFKGDNLGSHQIGGFCENFSSNNYICRYCYIKQSDLKRTSANKNIIFRNADSHEHDVTVALAYGNAVKGVKCNSVLNNCQYFNICNPGLPPCLAHDIFEGVVQYDIKLFIDALVNKKIVTYDFLNNRIHNISFVSEATNEKVPLLKKGDHLLGSASENFRLLLILPFCLHDIVMADPNYEALLKLREICCILMAAKLLVEQVAYLKTMIEELN